MRTRHAFAAVSPRRLLAAAPLAAALIAACAGPAVTSPPVAPATAQQPGAGADSATTQPGAPSLIYRFNAKFEPPAGRVVHGLGQWAEYNAKYVSLMPASNQPASELSFIPIADTVRPWNPSQIAAGLAAMDARGRIPLSDISLRGNQPTPAEFALLADKLYAVDDEIAHGTKWDSRIDDLAAVFKAFKKPMLLRIGGEFNGAWNGYHPWDYPLAFRKIVARIRAAGADNVAFVWCYEPAAPGDFDEKSGTGAWKWYPGDDAVDWFSIDLFAAHDVSGATTAHGGLTAYGRTIKFLDYAVATARPVVIAESAPMQFDLATQSADAWGGWFTPYFGLIASRPEIEWFVYINYDWGKATYYANQGWKNNDLAANTALAAQYAGELAKPRYLHSAERGLLKDYGKFK